MKKLILFKSPFCGPCKMFEPNLKEAAKQLNIEYEFIDVSTEQGLDYASEHGVKHSGTAWYVNDNNILITWEHPCSIEKLLSDINSVN